MNRDEHVQWCKDRALDYINSGDLINAFSSMVSDMSKHPETKAIAQAMAPVGMIYVRDGDYQSMRRWIEGFR